MGDISPVPTANASPKHPGIMLVRPNLHKETKENADTFKRWTVMHFRDLLNCPGPSSSASGISRTLRYTNTAGDLLYTIHADDIDIWKTQAYYDVSRRLDLENIRAVESGEAPVLREGCEFKEGSMVWEICNAEFAILSAPFSSLDSKEAESYHDLPLTVVSPAGTKSTAPSCSLVTLTYTNLNVREEPPNQLTTLQRFVLKHIKSGFQDQTDSVYITLYRHHPDAQPDMHPLIAKGKDGNGSWLACMFIPAEVSGEVQESLKARVEEDVEELKREEDGGWDVSVKIWRGEVFMS